MAMIEIYTRDDCCLCDQAKEVIGPVAVEEGVDVTEVDISGDSSLVEKFGKEIPVVFVGGRKAFKFRVDPARLRDLIRRANRRAVTAEGGSA